MSDCNYENEKPVDCVKVKTEECTLCRMHVADGYVAVPKSLIVFGGIMMILTAAALLVHAVIEAIR
jgi:hypothetical protein